MPQPLYVKIDNIQMYYHSYLLTSTSFILVYGPETGPFCI